jgi:hypothetical protein
VSVKLRILEAALFASAAAAILYLPSDPVWGILVTALFRSSQAISPYVFALAAIALFIWPRLGHLAGLCAGLLALPWFVWTETRWPQISNSWIALNTTNKREDFALHFAQLKILTVGLIVIAVSGSMVRLLPANWMFRGSPLSKRTWPAFGVCFFVFAVWFGSDVMPYRLPGMITRGLPADLEILHVEKSGLQFHEVTIGVGVRVEKFNHRENRRRLFEYRFTETGGQGTLPPALSSRVLGFIQTRELQDLHTPRAKALRAWNAEGWYVFIPEKMIMLAFTSENGAQAPEEVIDLFREIENEPLSWKSPAMLKKDVCLGFCYDPFSGLGAVYANERCSTFADGTRCN